MVIFTKATKLGLDLQGGVQLVYQGKPTKQQPKVTAESSTARSTSCATASTRSASPSRSSSARAPTRSRSASRASTNAERAADQVGTTAQLYFYDWEPNILDEDCKTNPDRVNGGQQPITGLYNAVKRASKCPPEIDNNNSRRRPRFYAFDKVSKSRSTTGIPDETREAALDEASARPARPSAEILEVRRASSSCATRRPSDQQAPRRWTSGGS